MTSKKDFTFNPKQIVTPNKVLENHTITINKEKISQIKAYDRNIKIDYPLDKMVIYPGLINAHDHLLGSYYPRIRDPFRNNDVPPDMNDKNIIKKWKNSRGPYLNWKEW